jgi:hypothetical protein
MIVELLHNSFYYPKLMRPQVKHILMDSGVAIEKCRGGRKSKDSRSLSRSAMKCTQRLVNGR